MRLLSIDPGKSHYAWAQWDSDTLVDCGRTGSGWSRADGLEDLRGRGPCDRCVIELPQVYAQRHWKGDPNDLIQVALTVGALEVQSDCQDVLLVQPHQWKGSVPKDVMGARIREKLSEAESRVLRLGTTGLGAKVHDVVDAVGIGLWALGRL